MLFRIISCDTVMRKYTELLIHANIHLSIFNQSISQYSFIKA